MTAGSEIVRIPLNKLVPSPSNVRKTGGQSLEELIASIRAHGLLHNLVVTKQGGAGDSGAEMFQVIAGGRRHAALMRLCREKAIPKNFPVPCRVVVADATTEASLAENVVREPMHPADQFEAFRALVEQGLGPEEVAARFGVTPAVVRQRLRLANVSPRLLTLYRSGQVNLDQLMALAITDDHAAQERVWDSSPPAQRQPHALRASLTQSKVDAAADGRIRFIGMEAYTAAGGQVERDLFQPEHEGYLTNPELLERLVTEKLGAIGDALRAEGWKWVEVQNRFDAAQLAAFERLHPPRAVLPAEVAAEIEALESEREQIREAHQWTDDYPRDAQNRLSEIQNRIRHLSAQPDAYGPEEKAVAGALATLRGGEPVIYRGLIRPEDRRAAKARQGAGDAGGGDIRDDGRPDKPAGFSGPLIEELSAQWTAALRASLAARPDVALVAVTHHFARATCYEVPPGGTPGVLAIAIEKERDDHRATSAGGAENRAQQVLAEQRAHWQARLPARPELLWDWLAAQEQAVLLELLGFCAAQVVCRVHLVHGAGGQPRPADAGRLAAAVGLDMADWWKPTSAGLFSRMTKDQIRAALAEVLNPEEIASLKTLSKKDLAAEAERRLHSTRWLPALLRRPPATAP